MPLGLPGESLRAAVGTVAAREPAPPVVVAEKRRTTKRRASLRSDVCVRLAVAQSLATARQQRKLPSCFLEGPAKNGHRENRWENFSTLLPRSPFCTRVAAHMARVW